MLVAIAILCIEGKSSENMRLMSLFTQSCHKSTKLQATTFVLTNTAVISSSTWAFSCKVMAYSYNMTFSPGNGKSL